MGLDCFLCRAILKQHKWTFAAKGELKQQFEIEANGRCLKDSVAQKQLIWENKEGTDW